MLFLGDRGRYQSLILLLSVVMMGWYGNLGTNGTVGVIRLSKTPELDLSGPDAHAPDELSRAIRFTIAGWPMSLTLAMKNTLQTSSPFH